MIKLFKKFLSKNNLDGFIISKNDSYFTEYSRINNLSKLTNFTGSAGFSLILKNENYLFVDGRYTLQAKRQSGKNFKIVEIPYVWPKDLSNIKNKIIGFNPKLFTQKTLLRFFENKAKLIPLEFEFKNPSEKIIKKIYKLDKTITGEDSSLKIKKLRRYMFKNKINYMYCSASENVNWLLNVRGKDLPNSPVVNCKLIVPDNGTLHLFINLKKVPKFLKSDLKNIIFHKENDFFQVLCGLKYGSFCIDENTCSIFEEKIISSNFKINKRSDPIYEFKSIKNKIEIKNTINAHIEDGVALTKFLYWFKKNKKESTEKIIENKLEELRKKSKNYLFPSFDTIAGSGPNGAIIHYKSTQKTNRKVRKNDILLVNSGGQYKWGTTDVTRTTFFGKVSNKIKNNFTRVLKGHIAVVTHKFNKKTSGHKLDQLARKPLKKYNLNYSHGTGHGVGFFLNVHEGPQSLSKNNKVELKSGMILSNEPGFYLKNYYGIRIENLIYIKSIKKKLIFKNLTYAPIDLDLVNFQMLTKKEKNYLFYYHLSVYSKLSKYLTNKEKKWLINLIK